MKRSSVGGQNQGQNIFGDEDSSEDDEWSFSADRGTGSKKRKAGDKSWNKFYKKRLEYTPSPSQAQSESECQTPATATALTPVISYQYIPSQPLDVATNVLEIGEFGSPKKKVDVRLKFCKKRQDCTPSPFQALLECRTPVLRPVLDNQPSTSQPVAIDVLEIGEFESPKKKHDNRDVSQNVCKKRQQDYTPSPFEPLSECRTPVLITETDHQQKSQVAINGFEIGEFESPKKKNSGGDRYNGRYVDASRTKLVFSRLSHIENGSPVRTPTDEFVTTRKNQDNSTNVFEIGEFESPKKDHKRRCVEAAQTRLILSQLSQIENGTPVKIPINEYPTTRLSMSQSQNTNIDIGEFESPKKNTDDGHQQNMAHNSEPYSEQWTVVGGKRRKKGCLVSKFKAIVSQYDSSVRRFAQDYRLKKFDETLSMTLIIRHVCGREEKLIWTICRHVEDDVDRCIMFKPLHLYEIAVGVVLRLYQPWKEVYVPGVPISVIVCTDFYRIGEKREDYFEVSEEMRQDMKSTPVIFNSNYIKVAVDDELSSLLSSLLPFQLRNQNTISKQTKSLLKPSIDLDAVIYQLSLSSLTSASNNSQKFLLCDSDNCFLILELPQVETDKKEQLLQDLVSSQYMSFKGLCVISRTTVLEDARLFQIFHRAESNQKAYFTVGLRPCTTWEVAAQLDIPYHQLYLPQEMCS